MIKSSRILIFEILDNLLIQQRPDIKKTFGQVVDSVKHDTGININYIRNMVSDIIRKKIYLDFIISNYSRVSLGKLKRKEKIILYAGIYELLFSSAPPYAAVNENVRLAKLKCSRYFIKFVNSFLRKISAMKNEILAEKKTLPDPIKYSTPEDLIKILRSSKYLKDHLVSILQSSQSPPHYFISAVNQNDKEIEQLKNFLIEDGAEFEKCDGFHYLFFLNSCLKPIHALKAVINGAGYIQDKSSAYCAELIRDEIIYEKADFLYDCCCAPGTKIIGAINPLSFDKKISVIGADINFKRLLLTRGNFKILTEQKNTYKKKIMLICADSEKPVIKIKTGKKYIFCLDAPCSGIGIISKYPEKLLYFNPATIDILAEKQYSLLKNIVSLAPKDSTIIYSVCSITQQETFGVIERILNDFPELKCKKIDDNSISVKFENYIQTDKGLLIIQKLNKNDGFFIAKLKK